VKLENRTSLLAVHVKLECSFLQEACGVPSQFMRRVVIELQGRPDQWDWALFPEVINLVGTVLALKSNRNLNWKP
jgi:hypothetical protein